MCQSFEFETHTLLDVVCVAMFVIRPPGTEEEVRQENHPWTVHTVLFHSFHIARLGSISPRKGTHRGWVGLVARGVRLACPSATLPYHTIMG